MPVNISILSLAVIHEIPLYDSLSSIMTKMKEPLLSELKQCHNGLMGCECGWGVGVLLAGWKAGGKQGERLGEVRCRCGITVGCLQGRRSVAEGPFCGVLLWGLRWGFDGGRRLYWAYCVLWGARGWGTEVGVDGAAGRGSAELRADRRSFTTHYSSVLRCCQKRREAVHEKDSVRHTSTEFQSWVLYCLKSETRYLKRQFKPM